MSHVLFLQFKESLRPGRFVKRYKRFFVDMKLEDGTTDTIHCPNSGSMRSCTAQDAMVYSLDSHDEKRKLRHTLEIISLDDGFCCLNTQRANQLMEQFFINLYEGTLPHFENEKPLSFFKQWSEMKREAKFTPETRFDFCLNSADNQNKKCWIEVKSVSLKTDDDCWAFPDAVTTRGQKHLRELAVAQEQGDGSALCFVVMRSTNIPADDIAKKFRIAQEIDPTYNTEYLRAKDKDVKMFLFVSDITLEGFSIRGVYEL